MSETTIKYYFQVATLEVDARTDNFRPHKITLVPQKDELIMEVELSLTHENVANCAAIITAQLSSDKDVPLPILTPTGLNAIRSVLEAALANKQSKDKDDDDDNWDDEEGSSKPTKSNVDDDNDWDNEKTTIGNINNDDNWDD